MSAITLDVGDVRITRIEETYQPAFPIDVLCPAYDADALAAYAPGTFDGFIEAGTGLALVSVHAWAVQTGQSTILVDTCTGNHKHRPTMEAMHQLDTPWLSRLAEAGIEPGDVTAVVCTHIHLDHVGWNTTLVDGEWVPTFPNAKHYINRTEFEFWNPTNPAQEPLEFNAGVFADSIAPVFDRDLVELWDTDCTVDDLLHLELAAGHTPGHAIGWLESKGERALFSGDSMHTPVQVYQPGWNSGFCIDGDASAATRKTLLERAVEHDAVLLPAHFSAPHAFRVRPDGDSFSVESAV